MSLGESLRKEWYRWSTARRLATNEWRGRYWYDADGCKIVPCRQCPKFDASRKVCRVPYGTPVRKCVVASLEAHLHGTKGLRTLELGYGRRSLAKHVIERSGGSWTGVEPLAPPGPVALGEGGYGHAASIPFPDETFDIVFGIQSLEHWEEPLPSIAGNSTYAECVQEVWRVLKPGGSIYFDAPVHLHGHEMFVLGDTARARALFDERFWSGVTLERWRYDHEPLPKYPTPPKEIALWRSDVAARMSAGGEPRSVWLLVVTARKSFSAAGSGSAAR
jgi:SAM-dependent methyltransferase